MVKTWIWLVYLENCGRPYGTDSVQGTPKRPELLQSGSTSRVQVKRDIISVVANCLIRRHDCALEFFKEYPKTLEYVPSHDEQLYGEYRMVS
jgi:hypothetical protein